jgi:hypothetical protein
MTAKETGVARRQEGARKVGLANEAFVITACERDLLQRWLPDTSSCVRVRSDGKNEVIRGFLQ